jgi:hypothetical protein
LALLGGLGELFRDLLICQDCFAAYAASQTAFVYKLFETSHNIYKFSRINSRFFLQNIALSTSFQKACNCLDTRSLTFRVTSLESPQG